MTIQNRFAKLHGFLNRNRKLLIFGLVMFSFFAFQFVFAQTLPSTADAGEFVISIMLVSLGVVYNVFAWVIGQLIVLTIGMVLIPILGYNNFADSHVINIAWPLVRDIMNMGVIIVLLFIAIQKMLGIGKAGVDQALVRLFGAVVALNFSRTICVLIIDASQVVMFTFVNALRDIAAGNFAGLFNVNSLMSVNSDVIVGDLFTASGEAIGATSDGLSAFSYLGTAYATVVLLSMVLAVMLIMAVVFIYRIVVLWVLVILSPIVFFLMGVSSLIPGVAKPVGEWKTKFAGAVTLGPILVFFLWLALAAAGSGSIAAAENFPSVATTDSTGLLTDAFKIDEIMSLFIGVILLLVGLQAAQGAAGQIGGVASQAFGKGGWADKGTKALVTAPARLTYGTAALAGRGARAVGSAGASASYAGAKFGLQMVDSKYDLSKRASASISRASEGALGGSERNFAVRALNQGFQRGAGVIGDLGRDRRAAEVKASADTVGSYSGEEFNSQAKLLAGNKEDSGALVDSMLIPGMQQNLREVGYQVVTDKGKEGQVKKHFEDEYKVENAAAGMNEEDSAADAKKRAKEEVEKIKASAMSVIGDPDEYFADDEGKKKKWKTAQMRNLHLMSEGDQGKIINDADFKVNGLGEDAINNPNIQELLKNRDMGVKFDKDGNETDIKAWDKVLQGGAGADAQKAARGIDGDVRKRVLAGEEDVLADAPTVRTRLDIGKDSADRIARGLKEGEVRGSSFSVDQLSGENKGEILKGIVSGVAAGGELRGMSSEVSAEVNNGLAEMFENAPSVVEKRNIQNAMFANDSDPKTLGIGIKAAGAIEKGQRRTVEEAVRANPKIVMHFTEDISGSSEPSALTETIANTVKPADIKKLVKDFEISTSEQIRSEIKSAITAIRDAAQKEMARKGGSKGAKTLRKAASDAIELDLSEE